MNERIQKVLTVMVLGSLLVVSCSRPADPPASPATTDAKVTEPETPTAATAPAEIAETPKPAPAPAPEKKTTAKAVPAPAPAPAPVAAAPAPPPAPAPVPVAVAPAPAPAPVAAVSAPPAPPAPVLPTTREVTIPSGTVVALRMIDSVDSKTDKVGQTFKASLDSPIVVDGQTVMPKGSDAFVKLMKVESAGNLKGVSELQLQLDRLYIGNKSYTVASNTFQSVGGSQGKDTVKKTGIGAGLGAVIGAIAGGKKGAAIGAGVGGGAGVAAAAIGKGEQVRVGSEEQVEFRLEQPLNVTVPITGRSNR